MSDLSIIVVNHNSGELLERCLSSIPAAAVSLDYEVIVVDNASSNLQDIDSNIVSSLRWIYNSDNLGWAKANNQGVRQSSADIIVLLNPDAELKAGALLPVWRFFQSNVMAGPVGGKLLFSDGRTQASCGPFPNLGNLLLRLPLPPIMRRYYLTDPKRLSRVDWVSGAFMALRRELWNKLQGLDERFFLYYEDVDLCFRAYREGHSAVYLPEAEAYHHAPHALRKDADRRLSLIIQESRMQYFKKNRPGWEAQALSCLHKIENLKYGLQSFVEKRGKRTVG